MRQVTTAHLQPKTTSKGDELFLLRPHRRWADGRRPLLAPLTKKVTAGLDAALDAIRRESFGGDGPEPVRQRVLPAVRLTLASPGTGEVTAYEVLPVVAHFDPRRRKDLARDLGGEWLTRSDALARPDLSPTARALLQEVRKAPTGPLPASALDGDWTARLLFARDNDVRAFGPLFEEIKTRLVPRLWRLLGNAHDVEDVLSQVALSVVLELETFQPTYSAFTWLARIAENAAVSVLRKRGQVRQVSLSLDDGAAPMTTEGPAERLARAEQFAGDQARLRSELQALKPVARLAWRLRYEENMEYAEISETLRISRDTIATWIHRTRAKLAQQ